MSLISAYDFVGETIGSYRILERIGSGGMGQVYRGVHLHLDRTVAIKVMHGHLASDPDFQARFRREARAAASLEHPNIVAIHDFGEQEGLLYLVMELLTDGSVRTLLRERSADTLHDVAAGIDLVRQAAEGLAYAHGRGMIHRDVKPENLLLKLIEDDTEQGSHYVVKVADFGLARLAESSTMTMSGTLMGTPPYMSPEQCQGHNLDSRSDQYSLGVVLYEAVAGRRPFEPKTPTEAAYQRAHPQRAPACIRPVSDRGRVLWRREFRCLRDRSPA
jgi:serine/threonine protein kinase